jgi:hypothetical protein
LGVAPDNAYRLDKGRYGFRAILVEKLDAILLAYIKPLAELEHLEAMTLSPSAKW